jgi:hypothetical protein
MICKDDAIAGWRSDTILPIAQLFRGLRRGNGVAEG